MNANGKTISERVIGCAMKVSSSLGCGFLEAVYANALAIEMSADGLEYRREYSLPVFYRERQVGFFKADFIVQDKLVLELKAVQRLAPEHHAQLMNYLRAGQLNAGLLLNFGTERLGVKRLVLDHDDSNPI